MHTIDDLEDDLDDAKLAHELRQFKRERDKIKKVLKAINENKRTPLEKYIDAIFVALLVLLFSARVLTHWIGDFVSLEIGTLLVSIKIIFLMRRQDNYNHFMFMIVHTIDYRQNVILKRLNEIEARRDGDGKR